tara:strand:- start:100 stop:813 length:714 start_codon:yes stop_codon:yes gene_type:complete
MKSTLILIPSHNCTLKFFKVINELRNNKINNDILIVDDKSNYHSKLIIKKIKKKFKNINVLKNYKNLGQGGSIKEGIKKFKHKYNYICTMDDDGQHHVKDVKKILKISNNFDLNKCIIFGVRELNFSKTPIKSYIGNKLSSIIYNIFTKNKLYDTQTGLRFYSMHFGTKFLKIKANGFDFHNVMNFFIYKKKLKIIQIPIKTIYFKKNKQSRFRGFKDTAKILNSIRRFYVSLLFSN